MINKPNKEEIEEIDMENDVEMTDEEIEEHNRKVMQKVKTGNDCIRDKIAEEGWRRLRFSGYDETIRSRYDIDVNEYEPGSKELLEALVERLQGSSFGVNLWRNDTLEFHSQFRLFTDKHQYDISARYGESEADSYLGCILRTRKHRVMEDHRRSSDMVDGKLNLHTWLNILEDILGVESAPIPTWSYGGIDDENL